MLFMLSKQVQDIIIEFGGIFVKVGVHSELIIDNVWEFLVIV